MDRYCLVSLETRMAGAVAALLEDEELEVEIVRGSAQALERMKARGRPALALVDLEAGERGWRSVREAAPAWFPMIGVSESPSARHAAKGPKGRLGLIEVIAPTVPPRALRSVIRRALASPLEGGPKPAERRPRRSLRGWLAGALRFSATAARTCPR